MTIDRDHGDLDRVARAIHARALERLPARTRLALRPAPRRTAPAGRPSRVAPVLGWSLATAAAVALVVLPGLRDGPSTTDATTSVAVAAGAGEAAPALAALDAADADADGEGIDDAIASLDEDPDLYLWLASVEAQPIAME